MSQSLYGRTIEDTLPSDAEDPVADIQGYRLAVTRARPVVRRAASHIDEFRLAWAKRIVGDPAAKGLVAVVESAPGMWGDHLPNYFPAALKEAAGATNTATVDELAAGLSALVRCGFVVVRGDPTFAVTVSLGHASMLGREFVRHEEGLGNEVYWPGGQSGVTVGPGYDMGGRSQDEIVADMLGIGLTHQAANAISLASGATGDDADAWVKRNKHVVNLSDPQQEELMTKLLPRYEGRVVANLPDSLRFRLLQHEFDAFFSLAYNTTHYGHYDFNRCVQQCNMDTAASAIMTLVGGGPGIPDRRSREVTMLTQGNYILKPMSH